MSSLTELLWHQLRMKHTQRTDILNDFQNIVQLNHLHVYRNVLNIQPSEYFDVTVQKQSKFLTSVHQSTEYSLYK